MAAIPAIENPYLSARHEYQERYGSHITQARNWRLLCFLLAVGMILTLTLAIYAALRNPFKPIVIPIDSFGRTVGGGVAQQLTTEQEASTRNALIHAFVYDMRTVTSDEIAQRQHIERVYSRMKTGSPAHTILSAHYREHSPLDRGRTELINVQVTSVLRSTLQTYEATWKETVRDRNSGEISATNRWRAVFTTVEAKPKTEAEAWLNPLGIYITNLNVAQVQEDTK